MRLRYRGDGTADEETGAQNPCLVFGTVFVAGEWVEADLSPMAAAKLAGNPMFEFDGPAPPMPKAEAPAGDGDGDPAAEIPVGWDELPFLAQRAIAKHIDPDLSKTAKKADVQAVIEAELVRRASA